MNISLIGAYRVKGRESSKMSFKSQKPTIDDSINKTLTTLYKRAEREVPEYGMFRPVVEEFDNINRNESSKRIKLSIRPSTDKSEPQERIFRVDIFSNRGDSTNPIFAAGKKKDILNILKDENLKEIIKKQINKSNRVFDGEDSD